MEDNRQLRSGIQTLVLPKLPEAAPETCLNCIYYQLGLPDCEPTDYWWGDYCELDNFKGPHDWRTDVERPCPDYKPIRFKQSRMCEMTRT